MRKLPDGEALRRHQERNRLKNEKRKAERIAKIEAEGKLPLTEEQKKERKLELQRTRRKAKRKTDIKGEKKRSETLKQERKLRRSKRNYDRGIASKRVAKKKQQEEQRLQLERKAQAILKARRLKEEVPVKKILPKRDIVLSECIKIQLDYKTAIYVKLGSDVEAIRQKFLSR